MEGNADTPTDIHGPVPSTASKEPSMLSFQEILKSFSTYIKEHQM